MRVGDEVEFRFVRNGMLHRGEVREVRTLDVLVRTRIDGGPASDVPVPLADVHRIVNGRAHAPSGGRRAVADDADHLAVVDTVTLEADDDGLKATFLGAVSLWLMSDGTVRWARS